jgi:spermidine synthase
MQSVEQSGTVAGRLYAISTVGSLVGVFASALLLIPLLGTRRTFLVFALALAVVAVLGLRRRFWIVPLLIAGLIALPVGTVKADDDERVIWEKETEYQYARVVQDSLGVRRLELNEGQAVHSVYRPGAWLTNDYWDTFLALPRAALDAPPERIAILGNAAGTTARQYGHYFPRTHIDAVEIDGELSEVGRRLFDMRAPRLEVFDEDARPFLERSDRRYDAIFIDAYRQPYIPFYLSTKEFFELVADRLTPGGVVVINVGHPEESDALEKVLAATMREAFSTVLRDPVEDTNVMLVGTNGRASGRRLAIQAERLPAEVRPIAFDSSARLEPALRGGDVYTDDKAPVEWLVDASILEAAADGERGG